MDILYVTNSLNKAVERVAGHLPVGWKIDISIEKGAAWVVLCNPVGDYISIDGKDMTLVEQVNEALCRSKGFITNTFKGE